MFADSVTVWYNQFHYCDTLRETNFGLNKPDTGDTFHGFYKARSFYYPTDTGASYDGSYYINFDYQFSSDSLIVRDTSYFQDTIIYRGWRPGYAGFKTAWDYGILGYPLARYKYIIMAHKGPLSTHKVTIKFWYNGGACGDPSFSEIIGSFAASDTWKVDTIIIPDSIRNKADIPRNNSKYYEMVVLINNLDPTDTTSGPPGCLKIDNIRLAGCNPIDTSPVSQKVNEGEAVTLKVATSRADSADVLTYQWKKDGVDIAGANNPVYTLGSATTADAGVYTAAVTVSSTNLNFTSQGATLTVDAKEKEGCGCGAGTGTALIPPLFFKVMAHRKRKKKNSQT